MRNSFARWEHGHVQHGQYVHERDGQHSGRDASGRSDAKLSGHRWTQAADEKEKMIAPDVGTMQRRPAL